MLVLVRDARIHALGDGLPCLQAEARGLQASVRSRCVRVCIHGQHLIMVRHDTKEVLRDEVCCSADDRKAFNTVK